MDSRTFDWAYVGISMILTLLYPIVILAIFYLSSPLLNFAMRIRPIQGLLGDICLSKNKDTGIINPKILIIKNLPYASYVKFGEIIFYVSLVSVTIITIFFIPLAGRNWSDFHVYWIGLLGLLSLPMFLPFFCFPMLGNFFLKTLGLKVYGEFLVLNDRQRKSQRNGTS